MGAGSKSLAAHATPDAVIEEELRHTRGCRLATTANHSVARIMTEFRRLAEVHRDPCPDLTDLAHRHLLPPVLSPPTLTTVG